MKTVKIDNKKIWYDEELLVEPATHAFNPEFWRKNEKVIGSATGRGTTWFVKAEKIDAALRHYRRGGLFGKLISNSYIFTGWNKTRSYQEFQLLNQLIELGVNVPRPIAAQAVRSGLTYQADLLSEKIDNARDLVAILKERSLSKEVYQKIGAEICKMHDAQVNHTDLNIHNILIDADEKVWIIDFDKCYQQNGDGWKQSNLDRLKRSFEKELNKRQIKWVPDNFDDIIKAINR